LVIRRPSSHAQRAVGCWWLGLLLPAGVEGVGDALEVAGDPLLLVGGQLGGGGVQVGQEGTKGLDDLADRRGGGDDGERRRSEGWGWRWTCPAASSRSTRAVAEAERIPRRSPSSTSD
jgi:hypothetical protein